jgi:hypothetical protein
MADTKAMLEEAEELEILAETLEALGANTLAEAQAKRPNLAREMSAILAAHGCEEWIELKRKQPEAWKRILADWDGAAREAMH